MTFIFGLGLLLILVFSASVAAYFVYFKMSLTGSVLRATLTFVIGAVVFVATFAVSIILIWPPYLWSMID